MMDEHTICVVIPARNEEDHIQRVLETLPVFVDHAVVIDDGSIDSTYERATSASSSAEVQILKPTESASVVRLILATNMFSTTSSNLS